MTVLIPLLFKNKNISNIQTPYTKVVYEIQQKTMLEHVLSYYEKLNANFVFVISKEDLVFGLDKIIKLIIPECSVVVSEGQTSGAILSCLLAIEHLKADDSLIIAGGDQIVTVDLEQVVSEFKEKDYDGGLITFKDVHPRWSYVLLDKNNFVIEAAEKLPISNVATSGFYYFKRTEDFINGAFSMIKKGGHKDGTYYICPVYNELILNQKRIGVYFINKTQYFNLSNKTGIEMYEDYLKNEKI